MTKTMTKSIRKGETDGATSADVSIADPNATVILTGERVCEVACLSNQQPTNVCEDAIRALAHSKWEAAGSPVGDGLDFWLEAEREVIAERSGSNSAHNPEIDS